MKKPWSISTTVRSPERLRDFLTVLKEFEGQEFNKENQIKYQVLLIQNKFYKPRNIPLKFREYFQKPELGIPYEVAEEIFYFKNYEDPPMRGRQSANPLNKLGFAIAREGSGPIQITELGNKFLAGDYDIGFIFFKSLLKLQFPNPWSADFSEKEGFNIMPLVATMHLLERLNRKSTKIGLDKTEFSIFVPTLINANQIDEYVEKISEFRKEKHKDKYITNFTKEFYETKKVAEKKIKNLFDYGDNIMRYFRLTRYFKITMDPLGYYWTINLEPSRMVEIEQLLKLNNGEAIKFKNLTDYLNYLSDITKPELPWEKIENLAKVTLSLKNGITELINRERMKVSQKEQELLIIDIKKLSKQQLENYTSELRTFNLELKERLRKAQILGDAKKIQETIDILKNIQKYRKTLEKKAPEQFEKLITQALKEMNDEILIKANYPVDDDGEPISHSPGNKPDMECYYQTFKAICEVTLNTSSLQWVQEGQPVMRHLRDFETQHQNDEVFCLFIAPQIHNDTYSQFWISVKYEYNGLRQRIVPITTDQFTILMDTLLDFVKQGRRFSHRELYDLYSQIINQTVQLNSFTDWATYIPEAVKEWRQRMIS
ncbi:MAG: AlwI family type II restriction endonuclease [candidate division Zixibacteria bacterium]|nr:AlwI family type II restriction endonuclease [candidate division Zixibacteria bacterium]